MRVEPVAVSGNSKFKDIAIGNDHACGISSADEVYCWGDGAEGKLGTRSSDNKQIPTKVVLN
jgi:alpha-tubulin suppressor-like RCC1 family protein